MGYTTTFSGKVSIVPPASAGLTAEVNAFCEGDHRDSSGFNEYYDLEVSHDGTSIHWTGAEKSYEMDSKMRKLIDKFFKPNGHVLNGTMEAQGEESNDRWALVVKDNVVSRKSGRVVYD